MNLNHILSAGLPIALADSFSGDCVFYVNC